MIKSEAEAKNVMTELIELLPERVSSLTQGMSVMQMMMKVVAMSQTENHISTEQFYRCKFQVEILHKFLKEALKMSEEVMDDFKKAEKIG